MPIEPAFNFQNEAGFTSQFLLPLLGRLGYTMVAEYHGQREFGKDLVFGEIDRLGHPTYHGLQAKYQDSISQSDSEKLIDDCRQAFRHPFRHPTTGAEHRISTFVVANAGGISDNARENFFAAARNMEHGGSVKLLDGKALLALDRSATSNQERPAREQFTRGLTMDVLISWSRTQSREMASVFYGWLPKVLPGLKPWMSSKDIDKGKQWFGDLQSFLGEATSCIVCVTEENVGSPWIYYETGAIAAKKHSVSVCPYLVGIGVNRIAGGPFGQYQSVEATKDDTLALVLSLNRAIPTPHNEELLRGNFESKWPEFEAELARILDMEPTAPAVFVETEADMLAGYTLPAEATTLLREAVSSLEKVRHLMGHGFTKKPAISDNAPRITVKTLIIPGDKTPEGTLVKGVSALWFEMLRMIRVDPDSIYKIDCWKWEEIIAGAYKQGGWETVVLTPKRGDHGIDVIAERKERGQLRFLLLDQVKIYKPGHLVGPDEIREMEGVLMYHAEASKGLITTTTDFTPGALAEARNLYPRLELRPRDKLLAWLASVTIEDLRASGISEAEGPDHA